MRRVVLPSLLVSLLLMPGVARSQDTAAQPPEPPRVPKPVIAPKPRATSVYVMGDYFLDANANEALQIPIDLDAKDMPVLDAIKSVLDTAKVKYEIASDVEADIKVTMTLKNVPAAYALMILTREAKLGWVYEKKDDKEMFRIVKRDDHFGNRFRVTMPDIKVDMPEMENAFRTYMTTINASPFATARAFPRLANLPDVRVKIDVRNSDVRDTLKKILEQAKLDYVLDDDVPGDAKRSFTFENIPLATALDTVCQSVEIGWRAEMRDKKVIVLVGKKYTRRSWYSTSVAPRAVTGASLPATLFTSPIAERRATFTCPHCKARIVVVLPNSRAVRIYEQGEAQEKAKEKETNRPWKFCPVCGKSIDMSLNVHNDAVAPLTMRHITALPELIEFESQPFFRTPELAPLIDAAGETFGAELEIPAAFPNRPPCDTIF